MGNRMWSDEEVDILRTNLGAIPNDRLAKMLPSRTWTGIFRHAQDIGLRLPNYKGNFTNHKFLDRVGPPQAYFLGFLAADGYVSKHAHAIQFGLKAKDRQHLQKIADIIPTTAPVSIAHVGQTKQQRVARLVINSAPIHARVKTLWPRDVDRLPSVPYEFRMQMLLGFFDGDGSVYAQGRYAHSSFVGTIGVLEQVRAMLSECGVSEVRIQPKSNTDKVLSLRYAHQDTKRLYRLLYKDRMVPRLERKENRFKQLLGGD